MLLVAVIALTSILRPVPAVAATPPLLDLTPVSAAAPELLKEMETMRRTGQEPGNTIRTQTWALNTTFAEDGTTESTVVEPQWSETAFRADGSVHYRLIAAEPFPGQNDDTLPAPGTVLVDGVSVCSCLQFAVDCEGRTVSTIEGVSREPLGAKLEQAFVDCGAVQCGFCTPGMVVQARHFLDAHPNATRDEIKRGIEGNLCRCTGYVKIVDAIEAASRADR